MQILFLPLVSCTKAFTGALVGQLEDKDQLDIDASVRDYLPALKFYNDNMNRQITIKDMLCHRTGLPRHDLSWYMFPSGSRDSLLARLQYQEPTLDVREGFQYNNFMFMALGALAEEVSKRSWEENIKENIFKPLKMSRSNLHISELIETENIAKGYSVNADKEAEYEDYYRIRGMAPAGSINSSAMEMGNWLIAWINEGKFEGEQVLPSEYVQEAMSSQIAASASLPGSKRPGLHFNNYGFGWSLDSYNGHYRVEHGGNIDGFSSSACFFPSDSIGIVVLVNQNYSRVPSLVRNMIADKMLGLKSGKWDEALKKRSKKSKKKEEDKDEVSSISAKVKNTKPSHEKEDYTGNFTHSGYGTVVIKNEADSLVAVLPEREWWLKHYHYDVFEPFEIENGEVDTSASGGLRFNFRTDANGEIVGFTANIVYGLDPILFEKQVVEIEIESSQLEQYVGKYDMGGAHAKVYIENENTLMLYVPGQPEYTLIGVDEHKFKIRDLEGFSVEFEEKEGENTSSYIYTAEMAHLEYPKKISFH